MSKNRGKFYIYSGYTPSEFTNLVEDSEAYNFTIRVENYIVNIYGITMTMCTILFKNGLDMTKYQNMDYIRRYGSIPTYSAK